MRTQETLFVNKSAYDSKPKQQANDDDDSLEIDFGADAPKKLFPLKMDKKTTFAQLQQRDLKNEKDV